MKEFSLFLCFAFSFDAPPLFSCYFSLRGFEKNINIIIRNTLEKAHTGRSKGVSGMKKCMLMAVLAVVLLLATNASAQIPDFTASGKATVSIEPASTPGLRPGDAFSVNVTVDPAGKGVSGAEVKIAFNASVVECEDVSPGNLLGDSPLGKKVIDNENGMVWYALGRIGDTPVPTEKGTFAVLSFRVKEDAPEGTYYLKISSAKLYDENFVYISPIRTENGTFTIVFEEGLHITITTDKTEYTTGDIMLANITIANPTEETKHVLFNWWVTVPSKGFYTAPLATTPMTLPPSYNKTLTHTITVGYWGAENFGAVFCVALTNQTSGKIISFDATFWNYNPATRKKKVNVESIVKEIKRVIR